MPSFGSFRTVHSLLPRPRTSAPSATASGRPHSRGQLRLFPSALRLLPASGTEKGGRTETRWVRRRDTEKGRGPGSLHLALRVGRAEGKKGRSRGGPKKVARDKSRQRGEGCARPLRRLPARLCAPAQSGRERGGEICFCACVEVGLRRGFSPCGRRARSRGPSTRARDFPLLWER